MGETKNEVHAVFDSASLERQAKMALIEKERQVHKDLIMSKLSEGRIIRENDLTNWDLQAGKRYVDSVLRDKLLRLVPSLTFKLKEMPALMVKELGLNGTQQMRSFWYPTPTGSELYCGATLYPVIQEFDIIVAKRVVMPSINPSTGFLEERIEGLPDPTKYNLDEPVYEGDDLALTSDEQWVWEPDNRIPGWRSVLLRLIQHGLVTPLQVEREFLAADRASWAVKTGRQSTDQVLI